MFLSSSQVMQGSHTYLEEGIWTLSLRRSQELWAVTAMFWSSLISVCENTITRLPSPSHRKISIQLTIDSSHFTALYHLNSCKTCCNKSSWTISPWIAEVPYIEETFNLPYMISSPYFDSAQLFPLGWRYYNEILMWWRKCSLLGYSSKGWGSLLLGNIPWLCCWEWQVCGSWRWWESCLSLPFTVLQWNCVSH